MLTFKKITENIKSFGYNLVRDRKARYSPPVEIGPERSDLQASGLSTYQANKTLASLRDIYRNYTAAKNLVLRLQLHVIGCGPKAVFNTSNTAWNTMAKEWLTEDFAKNCSGRTHDHLHDNEALIFNAIIREHDCLAFFDRAGSVREGKYFYWETDQIVSLKNSDWKNPEIRQEIAGILKGELFDGDPENMRMDSGIITDSIGLPIGYIVHSGRGQIVVSYDQASILPHGAARLIRHPFRLNQGRGIAALLTAATNLIDCAEMLQAELKSAKNAANFAMAITKKDAMQVAISKREQAPADRPAIDGSDVTTGGQPLEAFEELTQGNLEYLFPGEGIEVIKNERPSNQMEPFVKFQSIMAGASMGLSRFYSLSEASASFSAVRAEMNLGETTFKYFQKFFERHVLDWEIKEAISWAISKGYLPNNPGWERKISFKHNQQPRIDEDKQVKADTAKMQAGLMTLQDYHGSEWRNVIDQIATEQDYAESKGVNLSGFQPDNAPDLQADIEDAVNEINQREPEQING